MVIILDITNMSIITFFVYYRQWQDKTRGIVYGSATKILQGFELGP